MNKSDISRRSNAQGKIFENQIYSACIGYIYEGRAYIDKIHKPLSEIKKKM